MRQPPENSSTGRCLRGLVEAEAGEDGGGAGGGGIGADRAQALVDLGEAVRVGGVGFGEQGEALGVALQHGVEQAWRRPRAPPGATVAMRARAASRMSPPSSGDFAGDGAQQRGLAGAVAADQADAAALDRR